MSTPTRRLGTTGRPIHVIAAVAALAAAVLLGWIPAGDTVDAAPAAVVVAPAAGQSVVRSGDTVKVSFTGMAPGPVSLYQCIDPAYLLSQNLDVSESCQLNTRVVATAGPDGSGQAEFPVFWRIDAPRQQQVLCLESDHCSIRVTSCPHLPESGPNGTLVNLAVGAVNPGDPDDPFDDEPVNPTRRFQRPTPTPPTLSLPDPLPNIVKPPLSASGGTGADLAMRIWASESLADPTVAVDASFVGRDVSEAYDDLLEGRKDFVVAAMPVRGELIYPYQEPLPLDPSLTPAERAAAIEAREADKRANEELQAETNVAARSITYVPLIATSLDVVFDIAPFGVELEQLRLDSRSLALMFGGGIAGDPTISAWRDPAIRAMNPDCPPVPRFSASVLDNGGLLANASASGQATPVRAMNRSDIAESSFTFREWLGARNPDLAASLEGPSAQSFRNSVGRTEATGSEGVGRDMSALSPNLAVAANVPTPGRVGYLEHPYALMFVNRVAEVKNASGVFVSPNQLTTAAALQTAVPDPATGLVAVNDTDRSATPGLAQNHYPVVQVLYAAITPDLVAGPADEVAATRDFLALALSDKGQLAAERAGYTRLPNNLRQLALTQLNKATTLPPASTPPTSVPTTTVPAATAQSTVSTGVLSASESSGGGTSSSGGLGSAGSGGPLGGGYGGADALEQTFESGSSGSDGFDGAESASDPPLGSDEVDEGSGGVVDSVTEAVAKPVSAVLDVLSNPGQAPGLFTLMVVGGACCVVGPILSRRRSTRVSPR